MNPDLGQIQIDSLNFRQYLYKIHMVKLCLKNLNRTALIYDFLRTKQIANQKKAGKHRMYFPAAIVKKF